MNKEELKKILTIICDNFVDTLLVGSEENEKDFPYTIAVENFIAELKNKKYNSKLLWYI